MARFIVLLGPPGVGKGTQAKILTERTGLVHISTGDLFREHIRLDTELGKLAQKYMHKGGLVPDDVTVAMVKKRISRADCKLGVVLDGFPRTIAQAKATRAMLDEIGEEISVVPYITVSDDVLIKRLSGRRTCRENGHIFHVLFNPPKKEGVCDIDGSELYQRDDDTVETAKRRIQVYAKQTSPLIEYYRKEGKLAEIQGDQSIEDIAKDLLAVVEK